MAAAAQAAIRWPERILLARAPTPLEPIASSAPITGWMKRDDLTGIGESGNKVRKLEYLMADAQARGARAVMTCGGVNSNHARATAVAAHRLGMKAYLLLRGADRPSPTGNLLLNRILGAEIRFIERARWPERDVLMRAWADELRDVYIIPMGGSNALGALGYARAAEEIVRQATESGLTLDTVVHAAGSGGTTAGLALGFAALGREDVRHVAVQVDEDPAMKSRIDHILDEAVDRGFTTRAVRQQARFELVGGWGLGYAQAASAEIDSATAFARATGVFVDPVYTGKAVHWLRNTGRELGQTVFVHTGGIFELFAYAEQFSA